MGTSVFICLLACCFWFGLVFEIRFSTLRTHGKDPEGKMDRLRLIKDKESEDN